MWCLFSLKSEEFLTHYHPELGDREHDAGQVVAQPFRQHLVRLRRQQPGPDCSAELALDHPHRRLDVAPAAQDGPMSRVMTCTAPTAISR